MLLGLVTTGTGLHGPAEESAFAALGQIPAHTTARLERLALESLLPALQTGDFDHLASNCLSTVCCREVVLRRFKVDLTLGSFRGVNKV